MPYGTGTAVLASAETVAVGTAGQDAADDPEIWVDPANPERAVILGTDKKAGLYVYNLDGTVRDFHAAGPLNNVDLRTSNGFTLIAASDRQHNGARLYTLDGDMKLTHLGFISIPTSESYGLCMGVVEGGFTIAIVGQAGDVAQAVYNPYTAVSEVVRRFEVGSQGEGCVFDERRGKLYIGEEAKGVWVYDAAPTAGSERVLLEGAPGAILQPDVEGLTILSDGGRDYLIASSQGDSAFAVWEITDSGHDYKGRFSVYPGNGIDAVTGTDGVAARGGQVGPYPEGIVVMQDDSDMPGEEPAGARAHQNFKIVDWRKVKAALGVS